jgi:hypothetical protein
MFLIEFRTVPKRLKGILNRPSMQLAVFGINYGCDWFDLGQVDPMLGRDELRGRAARPGSTHANSDCSQAGPGRGNRPSLASQQAAFVQARITRSRFSSFSSLYFLINKPNY